MDERTAVIFRKVPTLIFLKKALQKGGIFWDIVIFRSHNLIPHLFFSTQDEIIEPIPHVEEDEHGRVDREGVLVELLLVFLHLLLEVFVFSFIRVGMRGRRKLRKGKKLAHHVSQLIF